MARRPHPKSHPNSPRGATSPKGAEALRRAGVLLANQRIDEAIATADRVVKKEPGSGDAHYVLGAALCAKGSYDRALFHAERANALLPDSPRVLSTLGQVQALRGENEAAERVFARATELEPGRADAWEGLGLVLRRLHRHAEAETAFRRAIELDPQKETTPINLGLCLLETGRIHEACDHLGETAERMPRNINAQAKHAYALLHDDRATSATLHAAHAKWGALIEAMIARKGPPFEPDRDPDRALNVAYLSPDLHNHSVSYFLAPLWRAHNRERVRVFAYHTGRVLDDGTERLRALADEWRSVPKTTESDFVERIRQDRIDVLVELSGHYADNRLFMMARGYAPVQVTYLGYPATTGLTRIDARLVDSTTDPAPSDGADAATEELIRIDPCFLCYEPPPVAPDLRPAPPATRSDGFTFGSFNNLKKVGPWVLDAWAQILERAEGATLLLKGRGYDDPGVRDDLAAAFRERGIGDERVRMIGRTSTVSEHLATYAEVDLALDTFPYNGTTTTCEAAWMGVPTLSIHGAQHAARVTASINAVIGLGEYTAMNPADYVERAVRLSGDPSPLVELRPRMREMMRASALMDAPAFADRVERAYRTLWHRWLSSTDA